jgi:CDP-2,3-bis-(O-geranylgeranyl)-sn-glycerol synthase
VSKLRQPAFRGRLADTGKRAFEDPGVTHAAQLLPAMLLLIAANATPVAAAWLLHGRLAAPLDGGARLGDGTRVLGDHKTWSGLVAGVAGCAIAADLLGLTLAVGLAFGALSLLADAASSFVKRRLRLAPGTEIPGLDQVPEALLPLWALSAPLGIDLSGCLVVTAAFIALDIAFARFRHR